MTPPKIYTLSLHDALPISRGGWHVGSRRGFGLSSQAVVGGQSCGATLVSRERSEEHTSELQSHHDLVCRLLLEKKNFDRPLRQHSRRLTPQPLQNRL